MIIDINDFINCIQSINNAYTALLVILFVNLRYSYKNKLMFPISFTGNNIFSKVAILITSLIISSLIIYYILINVLELDVSKMDEYKQFVIVLPMITFLHKGDLKALLKNIKDWF